MKADGVLADFQFIGSRVAKLTLETRLVDSEGKLKTDFDIDYEIRETQETEDRVAAVLALLVNVKATVKKKTLFKITLDMEGLFVGNKNNLSSEQFFQMLEVNGLVVLMHLARAYLMTVTAQSGINPPLRLPMINVLKLREKKHASDQN